MIVTGELEPDALLVTAVATEGNMAGKEVTGYYYKHERPSIPMGHNPHKDKHYIMRTGFADWNMERPLEATEIDVTTLRKADKK